MNKKNIIGIILGVIVVAGAVIALTAMNSRPSNTSVVDSSKAVQEEGAEAQSIAPGESELARTITYSDGGFVPVRLTIAKNEQVTVINKSASTLEFASDDHPTHTKNSEINLADLSPGEQTTFTITKSGEWGFHNHVRASHEGKIIVE